MAGKDRDNTAAATTRNRRVNKEGKHEDEDEAEVEQGVGADLLPSDSAATA